jgi:hypothetical protein
MLRRHIACQRDGQAARLIRNKCRGRVTRRPDVRIRSLAYITCGRPRGSIGSPLGQGVAAYADKSAPDWVWTRVDTGPLSGTCPGMSCPGTLGPPLWVAQTHTGGPNPISGVRLAQVDVRDQPQRFGLYIRGSGTNLGGPDCISRGPALSRGVRTHC